MASAATPALAESEIVTPDPTDGHAEEGSTVDRQSTAGMGRQRQRTWSKTMTPAALAANVANAQQSTGPVTPEGKKKVSHNSLVDAFFAQQEDNIVGRDIASPVVYEEILNGLMAMYGPDRFLDKLRVRRLAALHFKRCELLERAEAGETTRSVLRHRRAVRFATPPLPPAEVLEKDPAALNRHSDGVEYLIERLEALMEDIPQMKTPAEVLAAVRALAAKLRPALPDFHADVAGPMARAAPRFETLLRAA